MPLQYGVYLLLVVGWTPAWGSGFYRRHFKPAWCPCYPGFHVEPWSLWRVVYRRPPRYQEEQSQVNLRLGVWSFSGGTGAVVSVPAWRLVAEPPSGQSLAWLFAGDPFARAGLEPGSPAPTTVPSSGFNTLCLHPGYPSHLNTQRLLVEVSRSQVCFPGSCLLALCGRVPRGARCVPRGTPQPMRAGRRAIRA